MATFTYVGRGIIGTGPINKNPTVIRIPPIKVTYFGSLILSQSQPHPGAEMAYTPPFITKMNPVSTGERLN